MENDVSGANMTQAASTETIDKAKHRSISMPFDGLIRAISKRVGRGKAKEVERFLKFAFVGTIGALVDLGLLNLLQATILPPVDEFGKTIGLLIPIGVEGIFIPTNVAFAVTISFVAAVTSNFIWNRFWTYPDSRSRSIKRQLTQFATVSVIGWLGRTTWITLSYAAIGNLAVGAIHILSPDAVIDADATARLGTNIATFMGIFVVMIWNFFANRYWTYNDVE